MAKTIKRVGPFTQTTRVQYSTQAERFVPGWDKPVGTDQKLAHTMPRVKMGQKMTPIGAGTLRPARR